MDNTATSIEQIVELRKTYHRLLRRQLRKSGFKDGSMPTREQLESFFVRIDEYYKESDSDRAMLVRTLDSTTNEMETLKGAVEKDRDRMRDLLDAVAGGLGYFANSAGGTQDSLRQARFEFVNYIESIIGEYEDSFAEEKKIRDEFVGLADAVIELISEASTAGVLQNQMELAGTVQRLMVPPDGIIQRAGLTISSTFEPAAYCGGDWWSIHQINESSTMIILGDITGHGVASAVMAGAAKGACDAIAHEGPQAIIQTIHELLKGPEKGRLAMTCAIGVIDHANETIEMTSAGHPFQLLVESSGTITPLIATGDPLGVLPKASASSTIRPFPAGSSVIFYTDGITECVNERDQQFGDRNFRRAIRNGSFNTADDIRQSIISAVDSHRNGTPLEDDITLVVAQSNKK